LIIDKIKLFVAGRGEAINVTDSLEEQQLRSKASLSQVINAFKVVAKTREFGNM
jgi:hypothetical protein